MAKITANGDVEVARLAAMSPAGYRYLWVLTLKGRVLRRCTDISGDSYKIYGTKVKGPKTMSTLAAIIKNAGFRVLDG